MDGSAYFSRSFVMELLVEGRIRDVIEAGWGEVATQEAGGWQVLQAARSTAITLCLLME